LSAGLKLNLHFNSRQYDCYNSNATAKPASFTVTLSGLQERHSERKCVGCVLHIILKVPTFV